MEMIVQFHTLHMLVYCQQNTPQYPVNRRLVGPRVSADFGRREILSIPYWELNHP
jgi:hypothetical protein